MRKVSLGKVNKCNQNSQLTEKMFSSKGATRLKGVCSELEMVSFILNQGLWSENGLEVSSGLSGELL